MLQWVLSIINFSHLSLYVFLYFYEGVLKKLFGEAATSGAEGKVIRQKCNQKCIDLFNKKIKIKKEEPQEAQEE